MRVAVDGSFLHLPPSGTGTYLRHLLDELPALDPALALTVLHPPWDALPHPAGGPHPVRRRIARLRSDRRVQRATWDLAGVARAARQVHADLLHIPHFAAPPSSGSPVVVTIHDVIPFVLPAYRASAAMRLNLAVMRRTVRRAALVLTPSNFAAGEIERVLGIPRERIRVTPEAAGTAFHPTDDPAPIARVRSLYGLPERYLFNVGGLDVRKNLPALVEALALALPRLAEPVSLVIAGARHSANPVVFPPLEPVIQRFGLERQVILTGRVAEADKIALYQGASLYVTPSLHEGFGLTALEAMACGVPTIAAGRASLPEVLGEGGMLVEPDPSSLAGAMVAVLNDPALAADLRRRALLRAAEFTWRRTAGLTLAAYREAIERSSAERISPGNG